MKLRIAIWAIVGALVVVFWRFYLAATFPNPILGTTRTLLDLTCPIALASRHAINFYSVLVINTGTYALIGALIEMMRGRRTPLHRSQATRAN